MPKHRTGYVFKRGASFYVRWVIDGKVFSRALRDSLGNPITNRREAEEARIKIMAPFTVADEAAALESISARLEGRRAELVRLDLERNPPLAIENAWREYLAAPNRPDTGPATLEVYEMQFGKFTRWMTEKHPKQTTLREINAEIAESYASHLNHAQLSPNTYNKHLNVLTLVWRVLRAKARITENPWEQIQRKRITGQSRRELTVDELRKICASAEGELRVLLAVGIYTGLRLGDCATLRWSEVDLPRAIIRRIPNKTARRNPKPVIVPVHPALANILAQIPLDKRDSCVLSETAGLYANHRHSLTRLIRSHFESCGIVLHKPGTGTKGKRAVVEVGFHSLRHTFVSLCRENNAPLAVVESIVGHANPAMTRHYTHVGELAASQAVAALPTILGENVNAGKTRHPEAANILHRAHEMVETINTENWRSVRAELLSLLAASREKADA